MLSMPVPTLTRHEYRRIETNFGEKVLIFVQAPECVDQRGLYLGKVENRAMIVRLRRGEAERSALGFLPRPAHAM